MENLEIARVLDDVADLLEIGEANPFRVRAYRNAARTVEAETVPLRKRLEEGADLTELPAVGKDIAGRIEELVRTGDLALLNELSDEIPRTLIEVMRLPGIGPKRASVLWKKLGVETVDELEAAAHDGRVAQLKGFGAKTQEKILGGVKEYRRHSTRMKLGDADQHALPLLEYLGQAPGIERLEIAGSYRRRLETVGDIDILAIAKHPVPVMECFTAYPSVSKVLASGETRSSVVLKSGLQIDLRVVPPESYGAALVYFTGSKQHNVKLRTLSLSQGLSISEYGVFPVDGTGKQSVPVAGRSERDVYAAVGLPTIPPELREDRGEIEAARENRLPKLIESRDLKGDLQMHTTWSDGKDSVEDMVKACVAAGYSYMALTDHSQALAMTGGLDAVRMREQWEEIAEVQARYPRIRVLRSMEVDILADGRLDLDDDSLAELDLVLASVHSMFDLPPAKQTARILEAISHPQVSILAHPTGRQINRREGLAFDLTAVLECAAEQGVAVECNAHPDRLDLSDVHLMAARRLGVKVVISTDAHRVSDLSLMRYGVEQARRAWLEKDDVLNTYPVAHLLKAIGR